MKFRDKYTFGPAHKMDHRIIFKEELYLLPHLRFSPWLLIAICALLISNILYFVSFLTIHWGEFQLHLSSNEKDNFYYGLWIACRQSDGFCMGAGFPDFFFAVRAFSVLTLLGQLLAVCLLIGHVLERLLDYDPCGLGSIAGVCFSSSVFLLITVSVFGARWPKEYTTDTSDAKLGYSFIIACVTIVLPLVAGVMCLLEIKESIDRLAIQRKEIEDLRPPEMESVIEEEEQWLETKHI